MNVSDGSATILDIEDERRRLRDEPGSAYRHTGAWLASAREAAGLSHAEAAAKIHIRDRHLIAIEEFEIASMPPRAYAIGFVRAYAECLGLDPDIVVARFKDDFNQVDPEPSAPVIAEAAVPDTEEAETEKPELSLIAVIAIIAFSLWCVWQITLPRDIRPLSEETALTAPPPVQTVAPQPPVAENVVEAVLIERIAPIFPMGCLGAAGQEETVTIAFSINSNGRVTGERIAHASNSCFHDAALNAVRRWRYQPRTVNGATRPAFDQQVTITFNRPL